MSLSEWTNARGWEGLDIKIFCRTCANWNFIDIDDGGMFGECAEGGQAGLQTYSCETCDKAIKR